jgi:hypothetical protein
MSEPLDFNEHRERAVHAAEAHDPFVTRVSITIAILAAIAATVSSVESLGTARAILASNQATLAQSKASNQWAFYQAKAIKKRLDEHSAQTSPAERGQFLAKANAAGEEQVTIQRSARAYEAERDQDQAVAELNEARHPKLTLAAAIVQISIAVSTLAIITKRRWPGFLAMSAGLAGSLLAAYAVPPLPLPARRPSSCSAPWPTMSIES